MAEFLRLNGYSLVQDPAEADQILVQTCGFSDPCTKQAIEEIERLRQYHAQVIVAGCVPQTDPDALSEVFSGAIIRNQALHDVETVFHALVPLEKVPAAHKKYGADHAVYYVTVCNGCPNDCAYCATQKAIGPLRSKALEACIREVGQGIDQGESRIILTGDNVVAYGIDIGETLSSLITNMPLPDGRHSAKIDSLRPDWLLSRPSALLAAASAGRIGMLISSVQSGSERLLRLMRRWADLSEWVRLMRAFKVADPRVLIGTEIIVGFPSETEAEVDDSLNVILEAGIDWGQLFAFSPKAGTIAHEMHRQIPPEEIERRLTRLMSRLQENGYRVRRGKNETFFCTTSLTERKGEGNPYIPYCADNVEAPWLRKD